MKKKINYLILLLTAIFTVGCTNVEDVSNTDGKADSQEVTKKIVKKKKLRLKNK